MSEFYSNFPTQDLTEFFDKNECSLLLLKDPEFINVINSILFRAETSDSTRLSDSFVDMGIVNRLLNKNHQWISGRRGTGKTHIFKILSLQINERSNHIALYIDCQEFGSTAEVSKSNITDLLEGRCINLFKVLIGKICVELKRYLSDNKHSLKKSYKSAMANISSIRKSH